jgi:hypothetical protein
MNRVMFVPLVAILLTAVPCAAQTKPIQDEVRERLGSERQAQLIKQANAERTEDAEVLRRILNHSLGLPIQSATLTPSVPLINGFTPATPNSLDHRSAGGWSGPSFPQPGLNNLYTVYATQTTPVGPFDGVSLPGYGVIYTLRIPEKISLVLDPPAKSVGLAETCRKCHSTEPVSRDALEPTSDNTSPPTEWDRTRQELRGAKPTGNPPQTATRLTRQQICQPGNMTDRIVEKLWQNMQHVRHLAPTDRVTVVITFDGLTGSSRASPSVSYFNWNASAPAASAEIATESSGNRIAGFTDEEAKFVHTGDNLMKEGKASTAVTAYLTALGRVGYSGPVRLPAAKLTLWKQRFPTIIENIQHGVADVRRKLASASGAAGNPGDAKTFAAGADNVTLEPAPATPPAPQSPPDRFGFDPEESKQLTLGDLHLKQGKPQEAAAAYVRALARFHNGLVGRFAPPSGITAAQRTEMAAELQKGVRNAYRHLAQAWLAAGDVEKGQAALNMAQKYTVRLAGANDRDKRVPVPAKLIISVTRADADKAGNNLLNFRKAVKVETIGFPPADPAKK